MKIHVGKAYVEHEKRERPECRMHVVAITGNRVELAYQPGGTIAVTTSLDDFERFWGPAPEYHKKRHPWRNQDFRRKL
jgi:hypothetical protein